MTIAIVHTRACAEAEAALALAMARWPWPGTCDSCGGSGSWYSFGSREEPPDGGPCICVEEGICSRCGSSPLVFDEDSGISRCLACLWTDDPVVWRSGAIESRPEPDYEPCPCEHDAEQIAWVNDPTPF